MDKQGYDKLINAFESTGNDLTLVEVLPKRETIPQEGIRFVSVIVLDQTIKRDLCRSIKDFGMRYGSAADPEGPAFRILKMKPDNDLDLLLEDVNMVGAGVEDAQARRVYGFQTIDVLDLDMRRYNVLTQLGMTSLGGLAKANPETLLNAHRQYLTPEDVALVDHSLSKFGLSVGAWNNDLRE